MSRNSSPVVWREWVVEVAGPGPLFDNRIKTMLGRAAENAGLPPRMVKSIWYGEIDDPFHRSIRLLHDAVERHRAQSALQQLGKKVDERIQSLAQTNQEFYRNQIDALVRVLDQIEHVASLVARPPSRNR